MERPERLHAVNLGLAAIYARLEESRVGEVHSSEAEADHAAPFTIIRSTETLNTIPDHPAARDVLHIKWEDEPGSRTYAESLEDWCKHSRTRIGQKQRELPEQFEQDLYCK